MILRGGYTNADKVLRVGDTVRRPWRGDLAGDGSVAGAPGAGGFDGAPRLNDGTISHNDPNLDNVVFAGERAVALIDFDLAGPGSAVWDVACAARLWAPLRDPADAPQARSLQRLRLFLDAYELPAAQRSRVIDALVEAHEWCYSNRAWGAEQRA